MRAVAREPFDVLVVRGTRVLGLPGLLVARARGKPVVMQAEINGELSGEAYTWGTPLDRRPYRDLVGMATGARNLLLRDAEAFVAMSSVIRDEFLDAGVPEGRVHLIPHGVDTERFRPASADEKAALRGPARLATVGEGDRLYGPAPSWEGSRDPAVRVQGCGGERARGLARAGRVWKGPGPLR